MPLNEPYEDSWRIIGKSVIGASHARVGKPNQDYIGTATQGRRSQLIRQSVTPPIVLAVSDGHGSSRAFRSEHGSLLAVVAARQVVSDFLAGEWVGIENLSLVKRTAEERLPKQIAQTWRKLVLRHFSKCPLKSSETAELTSNELTGPIAMPSEDRILLAYGATLVVLVLTTQFMLFLQLGDGDILLVDDDGTVSRPIPSDERLIANETFSLSNPDAWEEFKTCFRVRNPTEPSLILLATDGYANSFRDEASFCKVGSDLIAIIRENGCESVEENIEAWLNEASRTGSGDDVTVGIVAKERLQPLPQQVVTASTRTNQKKEPSASDGQQPVSIEESSDPVSRVTPNVEQS